MRGFLKTLPATMVAALLLLALACGGGSEKPAADDQTSSQTDGEHSSSTDGQSSGGDTSGALVADVREALGQSATRFQDGVSSVSADFTFDLQSSAFSMGATGEFLYQSPDQMYMAIKMSGGDDSAVDLGQFGDIEVLARDGQIFMNSPFTGWISMSFEEMGADAESLQAMMSGHSPFDYAAMVEKLGGEIEDLGTDQIDGKTYAHFQVTIDLSEIVGAFAESLGSAGGSMGAGALPADQMAGPILMDIWVEPSTMLPRRLAADAAFTMGDESASMVMEFNFKEYNAAVAIPAAPADAKSLTEIFSAFSAPEDSGN